MKKEYSKPGIIIEDFEISQSISTGCGAKHGTGFGYPNHSYRDVCGWVVRSGIVLWSNTNPNNCNTIAEETAEGYAVCYNNPEGGMNIFNS